MICLFFMCCVYMQITLATALYDRGLVMTSVPMESLNDDDDEDDDDDTDDSDNVMLQPTVDSASDT